MKVIIHGSVFTDNFGDVLFADLFYKKLIGNGNIVRFFENRKFGASDFLRTEIGYDDKCTLKDILDADVVVMMSGGYLGEDKISWKNTMIRYIKYIFPLRALQIIGKKSYFIGVGGGPLNNRFLRRSCVKAINKSEYISVRDYETYSYLMDYGVKKQMVITSDTAQSITKDYCIESNIELSSDKKYIFLHYVNNSDFDIKFAGTIVPALNHFLQNHLEYSLVVGTDNGVDELKISNSETYRAIKCNDIQIYSYNSVRQLCDVISKMDVIITPKLHVGIVASTFGKSVISFAIHREKTQRYYKQIGEEGRSIKLSDVDENIAYSQILKYFDKPIRIPKDLIEKARNNIEMLDSL